MKTLEEFTDAFLKSIALKRDVRKYVRDKLRNIYPKESECYICGGTEKLEFHHVKTVIEVLDKWMKDEGIQEPKTEGEVMLMREQFTLAHIKELCMEGVTLCKAHHYKLHQIYGIRPGLHLADKQQRWIEIQRGKFHEDT